MELRRWTSSRRLVDEDLERLVVENLERLGEDLERLAAEDLERLVVEDLERTVWNTTAPLVFLYARDGLSSHAEGAPTVPYHAAHKMHGMLMLPWRCRIDAQTVIPSNHNRGQEIRLRSGTACLLLRRCLR